MVKSPYAVQEAAQRSSTTEKDDAAEYFVLMLMSGYTGSKENALVLLQSPCARTFQS